MPLARLTHSFDDDAVALWNANFEQGVKIAKATKAKEVWPGKGPVIDRPSAWRRHHGHQPGELGHQQLRPDPRNPEPVDGRAVHLPDRGCVEPDLHDLFRIAARRRAPCVELGNDRELIADVVGCLSLRRAGRGFSFFNFGKALAE